mmetsp:Transcript_46392/g.130658  ORF Transcript_46392/g.130658 Transcript_46392/m.130658 type:complete len:85 (-) Transcript_46392:151-405(-)
MVNPLCNNNTGNSSSSSSNLDSPPCNSNSHLDNNLSMDSHRCSSSHNNLDSNLRCNSSMDNLNMDSNNQCNNNTVSNPGVECKA